MKNVDDGMSAYEIDALVETCRSFIKEQGYSDPIGLGEILTQCEGSFDKVGDFLETICNLVGWSPQEDSEDVE